MIYRFGPKAAASFIFLGVLLVSFAHIGSVNADTFSYIHTLGPVTPPTLDPIVLLGLVVAFVILVGIGLALRYRKHLKWIGAAALVIGVAVVGVWAVWSAQPSVSYWLVSADSTGSQDNTVTMYCENNGAWAATFDLVLSLDNAHISQKTSPPYQRVNNQMAKFSFTLEPGERQSRQAWYIIEPNVTDYYIDLTFQASSSVLVKSEAGGITQVSYQKASADTNYTKRIATTPPMPP